MREAIKPEDLRAWVESRRAAQQREQLEAQQLGPSPSSAIGAALALVALTGRLQGWPVPEDEVTARESELVRERWARVRSAYGKP